MRVIIIGSGVAGLTAALDLAPQHDVLVLTKADASESNTRYAQGGVAVVTSTDDTPASHVADTLVAGAGLSDVAAATVLCEGGPAAVRELAERGVDFDTTVDGVLSLGLEAAHAHPRILHVHGDATGEAISTALLRRVAEAGVPLRPRTTVVDVLLDGGRAVGVRLLDGTELAADAVVLATGGAGQLYRHTTNPEVATGDGRRPGPARRGGGGGPGVLPVPPDLVGRTGQLPDLRGGPRGRGHADRQRRPRGSCPTSTRPPSSPRATWWPAASRPRCCASTAPPSGWTPPTSAAEFLARRFPTIDASCRRAGVRLGRRPDPGHPRRALLDGRGPDRRLGPYLGARSVRRRRGRLHRAARGQPAGLQLAARGTGLRRPGRRGARGRCRPPAAERPSPADWQTPVIAGPVRRTGRRGVQPDRSAGPDVGGGRVCSRTATVCARRWTRSARWRTPGGHRRQDQPRTPTCCSSPGPWPRARCGVRSRAAATSAPTSPPPTRPRPSTPVWCSPDDGSARVCRICSGYRSSRSDEPEHFRTGAR